MRAIDATEMGLVSGGVASPYLNLMHPVNGGVAGVINPGGVMHVAGVSGSAFQGAGRFKNIGLASLGTADRVDRF